MSDENDESRSVPRWRFSESSVASRSRKERSARARPNLTARPEQQSQRWQMTSRGPDRESERGAKGGPISPSGKGRRRRGHVNKGKPSD